MDAAADRPKPAAEGAAQTIQSWNEALHRQLSPGVQRRSTVFAPRVLAMVVVLVVGYIAARLVARAITLFCEKIGLQRAAEQSGLAQSMQHMGINRNVPAILGTIAIGCCCACFSMAAFNILRLARAVSVAMPAVVGYIPKLLIAIVVVVVGLLLGQLPARSGRHQRRSVRPFVCRTSGQRLLLCAGLADLLHRVEAIRRPRLGWTWRC